MASEDYYYARPTGMEQMDKKRGGKRPGAGRPRKDYKTKTISFRVREEWAEEITQHIKKWIQELNRE